MVASVPDVGKLPDPAGHGCGAAAAASAAAASADQILTTQCAAISGCTTDGGAFPAAQFAASDLAFDNFHPNAAGHAKIAASLWPAIRAALP